MIAGSLVPERPIDDDEVRRLANRQDLSGRSHADEQPTTGGEKLLGDEDGERRADRRTDDAIPDAAAIERVEMGVVAGPGRVTIGAPRRRQMFNDIAVRVENADFRDLASRHALLPARLSQQRLRRENRRLVVPLARQDRRPIIASIMLGSHSGAPFGSCGRRSVIATAVTTPEAKVSAPTAAIAVGAPKASVSTPAESAPRA